MLAKVQKLFLFRHLFIKKMWKGAEKCAFSEFCRDSTKKNEFFSVFAAPKFGSMEISSYQLQTERKHIPPAEMKE